MLHDFSGVAFDYYDGHQKEESLGADSKKNMLKKLPNIPELFGFALFPASFMTGPQVSMRRYMSFVNGEFGDKVSTKLCQNLKFDFFSNELVFIDLFSFYV